MKISDRIAAALGYVRKPQRRNANYPAAQIGRLTNSWTTDPGAINTVLRRDLRTLRARSRALVRGDGYASKFVHSCVSNIAGPNPFVLQAKVKKPRGTLDDKVNSSIEEAWLAWSRSGSCDVTGTMDLGSIHRLIIRTLARDGEALLRMRVGRDFGPYGMQLHLLDVDRLDEDKNDALRNGGAIKMGVEMDVDGRPVAYHLLKTHPGEIGTWGANGIKDYIRVPADELLHIFIPDYPEQARGTPWLAPAMTRLYNLNGFEEAAVINARVGAAKMGFYVTPDGQAPALVGDATDSQGRIIEDAEPGSFGVLPDGVDLRSWDPAFPDQAIEPFIRTCLRGVAAGVNVAYHSLGNDPANVNYSTARVALLEERDMWSSLQNWYIEHVCRRIYDKWRAAARTTNKLGEDAVMPKYEAVRWQPKSWAWVDPLKDIQASIEGIKAGITSRTRVAAEQGEDIEDIFDEIAAEQAMAEAKGVDLEELAGNKPEPDNASQDSQDTTDESSTTPIRAVA